VRYPKLFTPLTVGAVQLKNRFFCPGHGNGLSEHNAPGAHQIAYYSARAKGGVALIVTEIAHVDPSAILSAGSLRIYADDYIPGFARLADALHQLDCHVFGQIFHPGREMAKGPGGTRPVALAPSALPNDRFHTLPREMSVGDIEQVVDCYAQGAARMQEAGLDGVQIVASHGYLPGQFLSSAGNLRTDAYGGSLDNRLRFVREIVTAVRARVGNDFVVGLRISGDEHHDTGLKSEEVPDICAALEASGGLDFFDITSGSTTTVGSSYRLIEPMGGEQAPVAAYAERVKRRVELPVLAAGRVNQVSVAEEMLANDQADAVGMVRALICDPELPNKARDGKTSDIRICIGCNQACIGHRHEGYPLSCIQHPETGRELEFETLPVASRVRQVMVVGGGPAGLKAAAVAAARGHRVTLHEREKHLGGQALLAQRLPRRGEFGGIVSNLTRECELAGVDVRTGSSVDRSTITRAAPDAVIIATGATPRALAPGRSEGAHVVNAWQVLRDEVNIGSRVVVADWACDWIGMGVAEMLARNGCQVRLAVDGYMAGQTLQSYVRDAWVGALHRVGVEVIPYAHLYGANESAVYFEHSASREALVLDDVDTLVTALGNESRRELEFALQDSAIEVHLAGDCLAARTAEEAVYEGLKTGCAV